MTWQNALQMESMAYTCGHCGCLVGSNIGYNNTGSVVSFIYICPHCDRPTYFYRDFKLPDVPYGEDVGGLPDQVAELYDETRRCVAASSYTAAVLSCRKLLMHIAVAQDAPEGESFFAYVRYLDDNGYLPPEGHIWVDSIRQKGNEANHEIVLMDREDAEELIDFLQMLMTFIYEFPAKLSSNSDDN